MLAGSRVLIRWEEFYKFGRDRIVWDEFGRIETHWKSSKGAGTNSDWARAEFLRVGTEVDE
jgi:hypothetical protein